MGADTSLPPSLPAPAGPGPSATALPPRSGRIAWFVIGGAVAVGIVMGFVLFTRAKDADIGLRQWMLSYQERGQNMTGTACVTEVIDWFEHRCEAPLEMCLQAVPMGVAHCLKARDRAEECKSIGNGLKDERWSFDKCQQVGIDKKSKKPQIKSCTAAWDALDTFCRSGQKGVVL